MQLSDGDRIRGLVKLTAEREERARCVGERRSSKPRDRAGEVASGGSRPGEMPTDRSDVVLRGLDDARWRSLLDRRPGDYVDTFAQDADGTWYFTERRFRIGRTGDLSRHLRYNASEGLP